LKASIFSTNFIRPARSQSPNCKASSTVQSSATSCPSSATCGSAPRRPNLILAVADDRLEGEFAFDGADADGQATLPLPVGGLLDDDRQLIRRRRQKRQHVSGFQMLIERALAPSAVCKHEQAIEAPCGLGNHHVKRLVHQRRQDFRSPRKSDSIERADGVPLPLYVPVDSARMVWACWDAAARMAGPLDRSPAAAPGASARGTDAVNSNAGADAAEPGRVVPADRIEMAMISPSPAPPAGAAAQAASTLPFIGAPGDAGTVSCSDKSPSLYVR